MIAAFLMLLVQATPASHVGTDEAEPLPRPELRTDRAKLTIPVGTEIHLRLMKELSTRTHKKGDTFELEVSEHVLIDGITAIPRGTVAVGELTRSDAKGAFGKSGKLEARVLYAVLPQGYARLSGRLGVAGEGATAATAVTAVLAGTLAFAVTGTSAVIPEGARLIALTDREISVSVEVTEENG